MKATKKNPAFRRRSAIEPLERRNLLAVDLVVEQVTDLPEFVAGEQITYEIRVTNNGPDDAIGATISDPVTESLDDVTWERTVSFQQDADKLNGTNGYWAKASRFQSGVTSVNSIGDVNADGIDDFAVSSNTGLAANGARSGGRVHIVFGNESPVEGIPDLTLPDSDGKSIKHLAIVGSEQDEAIGLDIVPLGDINSDGVDDLAITSSPASATIGARRDTYVVFGSERLDTSSDIVVTELDGTNGFFLGATMDVGERADINGDGRNDLVMLNTDHSHPDFGNLSVIFGPVQPNRTGALLVSDLDGDNGFTISTRRDREPEVANAVTVNDTNGDGRSDIFIHRAIDQAVYVAYGGEHPAVSSFSDLDGSRGGKLIQVTGIGIHSVRSAGDFNADGLDDLAIVAGWDPFFSKTFGYVVFGSPTLPETPFGLSEPNETGVLKLDGVKGDITGNRTILDLRSAGDVNNDGISDLVVGVPIFGIPNDLTPDPGTAYVVYGSHDASAPPEIDVEQIVANGSGFVFHGNAKSDVVGYRVAGAGDINNDGIDDLLVSGNGGVNVLYGAPEGSTSGSGTGDIREPIDVRVGTTIIYSVAGTVRPEAHGRFVPETVVTAPADEVEFDPPDNSFPNVEPGLLVDLSVKLEEVPKELNPGQEVTYTLRVENNGRDGAEDALVQHPVGAALESVRWTRNVEFDPNLDLDDLHPDLGISVETSNLLPNNHHKVASLGDINGDGFDDIAYGSNSSDSTHIMFGSNSIEAVNLQDDEAPNILEFTGDNRFFSVNSAGDFNGDGLDDFVLGSSREAAIATIVIGNATFGDADVELNSLSGRIDIVDSSLQPTENGWVYVDSAGDINSDGLDDILLRVRNKVGVVFGSKDATRGTIDIADLDGTNGFRLADLEQPNPHQLFIAGGGDVNGDGIDDLAIAVIQTEEDAKLFYIFGHRQVGGTGTRSLADAETMIQGGELSEARGVHINGDVNGDGIDDLLVDGGYFGVSVLLNDASGELSRRNFVRRYTENFSIGGSYDYRAQYAGDLNADGLDDIVYAVGRSRNDGVFGPIFDAYAGVLFGGSNYRNATPQSFENLSPSQGIILETGSGPISSAGDLNGDGADEFIMGDRIGFGHNIFANGVGDISDSFDLPAGFAATYSITGRVPESPNNEVSLSAVVTPAASQVEYRPSDNTIGAANVVQRPDLRVAVTEPAGPIADGALIHFELEIANLGESIAEHSSVTADFEGLEDIAWTRSTDFQLPNTEDVSTLPPTRALTVIGTETGDGIGGEVTWIGDVNGDGFDDIALRRRDEFAVVFGAPSIDITSLSLSDLDGSNGFVIPPLETDGRFRLLWAKANPAGDVNGDGIADLIFSSPAANVDDEPSRGKVRVVFGHRQLGGTGELDLSELDGTNGYTIVSHACCGFGQQAISAGDINADSFDDLVLLHRPEPESGPASYDVVVVFGGNENDGLQDVQLDGTDGFRIHGQTPHPYGLDELGTAGDVNGDGIDDLLIGLGARVDATPPAAAIIFGDAALGLQRTIELDELDGRDGFRIPTRNSTRIATGDINGDGTNDLVAGSPFESPNGVSNAGRVRVVWGGEEIGSAGQVNVDEGGQADFELIGSSADQELGKDLALMDVNGDGLDDIVSTNFILANAEWVARTHVYLSQPVSETQNEVSVTSLTQALGASVPRNSSRGDFNGDGLHDRLLGNSLADPNDVLGAGAVYVLFSQVDRGLGNVHQVIDVPMNETVRYQVTGRVKDGATSIDVRLNATPGPKQRDANTDNNVSELNIGVVDAFLADLNLDGAIDFADFLVIAENFGESGSREEGDIDGNGTVDFLDFLFLARNFGRTRT